MIKRVVGYSSVVLSVLIGILALASLSQKPVSYVTSVVLITLSVGCFAVSWVTLLGQPSAEPSV
ncbi:MAG: hypothetical protein ACXWUG_04500 [Polyangiales bacterium]